MKLVATDGTNAYPVRVCHWWPGREYQSVSPIPSFMVRQAERFGSRYLTFVNVQTETGMVAATARCCKKDQPQRATGRFIALLRLARTLKTLGMKLEVHNG